MRIWIIYVWLNLVYNEGGQILLDSSCKFYNNNAGFDYKSTEHKDTVYYFFLRGVIDFVSLGYHLFHGSQRNDIYDVNGLIKILGARKGTKAYEIKCENTQTSSIIYDEYRNWDNLSTNITLNSLSYNNPSGIYWKVIYIVYLIWC